ncbi:methionine ABC transporter ATP-binding protein [Helicobacter turcicus]|uniref:Methionine ABC transporter ATP-binding protein n=1 Tax=Helicobacter turcicus TaxID=2867412 RepID=A0ABS7JNV7_9HELI|nr:methionine ABC transporter ATP-binding protein [Helicobacter turcicus]MBX7491060.1 methionine ABC transporter ATP-binding protein [Helicobacter turcicus]MBX7546321.1 methionine ABC transporter ATP-binding protein [Helicobacter turcicus]
MDLITIKNLHKSFGTTEVLKDINLNIKKGSIFGLVGHSGAGKSTLLRTFNGLESINSGSINIDGLEVSKLSPNVLRTLRQRIGMIFQHFSLLHRKNVWENIILPLQCANIKVDNKKIKNLLELVGLEDKANSYPNALSGGQKQRVAIARALAMQPMLLLSDEATSALDPNITGAILELLKNINKELGVTIVLVTHEMEVVKTLCGEAAFMQQGEVLKSGAIEDLFLSPDPKMREFLGENEILPKNGLNIRIYFPKCIAQNPIITQMARVLDMDFNIVWGNLESFNGVALGVLVINIAQSHKERVCNYLDAQGAIWEIVAQKSEKPNE